MTISMGWIRTLKNGDQELVFASDSRVRFGGRWDCCPKLFPLPRQDCVICFAGETAYAYPFIIQAISSIENHIRALTRAMTITEVRGHLLKLLNNMVSMHKEAPAGFGEPDLSLIFGGYCWKTSKFNLWLLKYNRGSRRFEYCPPYYWRGKGKGNHYRKQIILIGDYQEDAYENIALKLTERGKLDNGGFDMEPLEVLRDMIKENRTYIGGSPQVLKVLKHLHVRPYAIYEPSTKILSFNGRPLLPYETTDHFILNIETLEMIHPTQYYIMKETEEKNPYK